MIGCSSTTIADASTGCPVQTPGPSALLFAAPYYTCSTNYYVSTSGSDSNPGTLASPWATLFHANASLANGVGGVCVNVVASATPYGGVQLTKSGSGASAFGYIVYRCTTLDGCAITPSANFNYTGPRWLPLAWLAPIVETSP